MERSDFDLTTVASIGALVAITIVAALIIIAVVPA